VLLDARGGLRPQPGRVPKQRGLQRGLLCPRETQRPGQQVEGLDPGAAPDALLQPADCPHREGGPLCELLLSSAAGVPDSAAAGVVGYWPPT